MQLGAVVCRAAFAAACVLAVKLCGFGVDIAHAGAAPVSAIQRAASAAQLPSLGIPFVANRGEVDPRVVLYAHTPTGMLFVGRDGVLTYRLTAKDGRGWALKERFVDARSVTPTAGEPSSTRIARFVDAGSSRSVTAAATYRSANLGEVWPGISVDVQASGANPEKYFRVAPTARVSDIRVDVDGARRIAINARGELAATTGLGEAVFSKPAAWQEIGGARRPVDVRYTVRGIRDYGFALGAYDRRHTVIIDPLLQSTFIGGTGGLDVNHVAAIAVNPGNGDVYVVGTTGSTGGFPVSAGAIQPTMGSTQDGFIAQLPANLKSFKQVTYYGGNQDDEAQGVMVHPNGDVYVAGFTNSDNLAGIAGGAIATQSPGTANAFIIRLDPTLTVLRQGTLYGNHMQQQTSSFDLLQLAADATGAVYLAGSANSTILQGTAGGAIPTVINGRPGFIAKFSADLKSLIQATYIDGGPSFLGLSALNSISALVIDPGTGDVLIAGSSDSLSLPVTPGAFETTIDSGMIEGAGFIARLPNTLTSFTALSYVGSHSTAPFPDYGTSVVSLALSPANGDIYVYGGTTGDVLDGSAGGYVPASSPGLGGEFLMQVAPDLSVIRHSTFLGTSVTYGVPFAVLISAAGDIYTEGRQCADTSGGIQTTIDGGSDICIARWTPDLHALQKATWLGGNAADDLAGGAYSTAGAALALGIAGDVYVAGGTASTNYPGTSGGAQSTFPAGALSTGYIARITADLSGTPQPGTLQFSAASYSAADNAGSAQILVNRSNGSSGAISVTASTSDGTGKAGVDYTSSSQVLTFADGDTTPKLLSVPVLVDAAKSGNKTVNLTLSAATGGATIGTQSTAVLTITATTVPVPGSLQFSASTYSAADNSGNVSISVTRTGGSAGAVSVAFATNDGTGKSGTNYTATMQTVAFGDGDDAAKTVSVPVQIDGTVGNAFTVNLALTAATGGATLGTPATAVLTINATTPVPVTPPPAASTVSVTGKGGGGASNIWEIALLGALLLLRCVRSHRFARPAVSVAVLMGATLLGATGLSAQAEADSPQSYVGFGIGQARSEAAASDLQRGLNAEGFPGAMVTLHDHKLAGKLYAGISLNRYLSFEAAYVDLNKVRTTSLATTNDPAQFVHAVTAIHPYSARGGSATALGSLPLVGGLSAFARGGAFIWHGEIDADIPGTYALDTKKTGFSGVAGAGLDFAFARHVAVRVEWERYFITRDSIDLLTVGMRFRF